MYTVQCAACMYTVQYSVQCMYTVQCACIQYSVHVNSTVCMYTVQCAMCTVQSEVHVYSVPIYSMPVYHVTIVCNVPFIPYRVLIHKVHKNSMALSSVPSGSVPMQHAFMQLAYTVQHAFRQHAYTACCVPTKYEYCILNVPKCSVAYIQRAYI